MAAPSNSPSRVTPETAQKAVHALLDWRKTKSDSTKPQLLEEDEFLYLILNLKKIPAKSRTNPFKISLPNPLLAPGSAELCLFLDDRPKSGITKAEAKQKIEAEAVPITKVISLSKLKSDYKPFEAKRKLCDSYDMFFVDKKIVPLLPKLIGKVFFDKKKIPAAVNLQHKNWKEQVERVSGMARLFLNTGTCSVVKVARADMEEEGMVENLVAAIKGVVGVVPKGWDNVRSLNVKLVDSPALALYEAVPELKMRIEGVRVEEEEEVKEEVAEKGSSGGKKKKGSKKGRIHEVKYMDSVDGDDVGEGEGDEMVIDDKRKKKKEGKGKGESLAKKAKKDELGDDENGNLENGNEAGKLKASGGKKRKSEEVKVKSSENGEALSKKPAKAKKVEFEVADEVASGGKKRKEGEVKGKKSEGVKVKSSENGEALSKKPSKAKKVEFEVPDEVASGGKKRKEGEVKSSEDGETLLRRSTRAKKDAIKIKESKKSENVEVKVKGKTKKRSLAAE